MDEKTEIPPRCTNPVVRQILRRMGFSAKETAEIMWQGGTLDVVEAQKDEEEEA